MTAPVLVTDENAQALVDLGDPDAPAWLREPAKVVGWIVTGVLLATAGIAELLNSVVDLLPGSWRDTTHAVAATLVVVGLIAARVQALLTRNGVGRTGNGKDGVWSHDSARALATLTAIEVAAAKNADPATHAQ